jgi:hypothetical protein
MTSDSWFFSDWFIFAYIYVSAALTGFGKALFWVAASDYVNTCASKNNQGLFNGTFWGFYMGSFIAGNLSTAMLLNRIQQDYIEAIFLTVLALISVIPFLLM